MIAGILMFIGYGWGILGLINIINLPWTTATLQTEFEYMATIFILNMIAHILPGLAVGAMGHSIHQRNKLTRQYTRKLDYAPEPTSNRAWR